MSKEGGRERVTRRVSFLAEEDALVERRAEEAGITVPAYIRQQALNGQVVSINWDALREHSSQISRIEEKIMAYLAGRHADVWMYEADLEGIHEELSKIRESEVNLIEQICSEI